MAHPAPMKIDARVSMEGRRLLVEAHSTIVAISLREESAEWIWVDVLGGGDRRETRVILDAAVSLTEKGLEVFVGTGPGKLPLFRTLTPRSRGVLTDRQAAATAGADNLWKPVELC